MLIDQDFEFELGGPWPPGCTLYSRVMTKIFFAAMALNELFYENNKSEKNF